MPCGSWGSPTRARWRPVSGSTTTRLASYSRTSAYGWVYRAEFAGSGGWALTETGKAENERQLVAELAACGASDEVKQVHAAFLPLNARFQERATRWQARRALVTRWR